MTVVGARPQFIKAMPVSHALSAKYQEIFVHTGQHYDDTMSDIFFANWRFLIPIGILALARVATQFKRLG